MAPDYGANAFSNIGIRKVVRNFLFKENFRTILKSENHMQNGLCYAKK
jgi:hypothetical protein